MDEPEIPLFLPFPSDPPEILQEANAPAPSSVSPELRPPFFASGKGVVYKRTNLLTDEVYVGQAKSWRRYLQRQKEHAKNHPDEVFSFEVLERADNGLSLDMAEETWIRRLGGPARYDGDLANKRWQMNQERYNNAGGKEPKP